MLSKSMTRRAIALLAVGCVGFTCASPALGDSNPAGLPTSNDYYSAADIGFHDYTRDGSVREIRNDLTGDLSGMVELVQSSSVEPSGNSAANKPTTVADREALLLFTPSIETKAVSVAVKVDGELKGTLDLDAPNFLPAADQNFDERGSVAYSLRAWSAELPWQWVQPGLSLEFTSASEAAGLLEDIDIAAPTEMVINNIELGMLTNAPTGASHRFIADPANGGTDYFSTLPLSKLTIAAYESAKLEKVIVASGEIYSADNPNPGRGDIYSGNMRENVGKAQVSTGINLATWGITSSAMNQVQPGETNQRVIHHSAGLYSNGVQTHGLSGGNGMATLQSSVGNELSHELGHSFGLGHYPGRNPKASGDDIIRDASHNMDSGWGYIAYRGLMRSNLSTAGYRASVGINGDSFSESLRGLYNFNTDAMSGGWDASPVSDYTHYTAYSQKRIQSGLQTLVADTSYPSGYRDWDQKTGQWVDAKELDPSFALRAPETAGESVFTILGGYNPANAGQTLVYPAFRSNYGVTFDYPDVDTSGPGRVCWLGVDYADGSTERIELDASNGVKQLNVNLAESDKPVAAQVSCSENGQVTELGNQIDIATDLEPLDEPVVIGAEAGYEALRAEELAELEPTLTAQAEVSAPMLSSADLLILRGWSDDLSQLGTKARETAERILGIAKDAADVTAFLAEHGDSISSGSATRYQELVGYLQDRGYTESDGALLPSGRIVTVDYGHCLYVDGSMNVKVSGKIRDDCAGKYPEAWYADAAGRIHPVEYPQLCLSAASPVTLASCASADSSQRWNVGSNGIVVRTENPKMALDYFREKGYPGVYRASASDNQIWTNLVSSTNPLVAMLNADGLQALYSALDPENSASAQPAPSPAESAAGNPKAEMGELPGRDPQTS